MAQKLNSTPGRQIPGDVRPGEVVIPARCGIHKKSVFLILHHDKDCWKLVNAVTGPESNTSGTSPAAPLQLQDAIELEGFKIAHNYPGCPCCGDQAVIKCGCSAFSCGGASRSHGDHEDHLCGTCDSWRCVRGRPIKSATAFANVSMLPPPPHIAPEIQTAQPEPSARTLPRPDLPQITPSTALERRRRR
jgi:hypothetical protein